MDPVTSLPHFDHFETERAGPVAVADQPAWQGQRAHGRVLAAATRPARRGGGAAWRARVLLTGSGDRSFSAGGDIEAFAELDGVAVRRDFVADCLRTFAAIEECRARPSSRRSTDLPWAAAASSRWPATWCWPPSTPPSASRRPRSGSFPASASCAPRRPSGGTRPSSWCWPASGISAQRAYELGLVQQVLPAAELAPAAPPLARRSPRGRRSRWRSASAWSTGAWTAARSATASRPSPCCTSTRDAAEGIRAFTERREPRVERDLAMEPFVALTRRYCIDYTARHDLSVCDDIMVPGDTLHMGVHHLAGRDDADKPAAAAQFRQFPGLCLTVNEIIRSRDRLALRFTEHGVLVRHDGPVRPGRRRPVLLGRAAAAGEPRRAGLLRPQAPARRRRPGPGPAPGRRAVGHPVRSG